MYTAGGCALTKRSGRLSVYSEVKAVYEEESQEWKGWMLCMEQRRCSGAVVYSSQSTVGKGTL